MKRTCSALLACFLCLASVARAADDAGKWYKGNLHTHSLWSDGDNFPEMIADWYASRDYNFLALTDHNVLSEGERWVPLARVRQKAGDAGIAKYRERFPEVVQVRKTAEDAEEIRLQPLEVTRKLVERPGEFLMIQGEEISDGFVVQPPADAKPDAKPTRLPIHMNASNLAEVVKAQGGTSVQDVIRRNFLAVEEQAKRLNRPILTHLNHPNFQWGVAAEELAHVVEERYFEIYNGHPGTRTLGDATHPSLEKLWDVCNTIRLAQLDAEPLMGLATDDSHHYHTPGMNRSTPGRGWVMVRAAELTPEGIVNAMKRGDFYASSGVTLKKISYEKASKSISLEIEPDGDAKFTTTFVGTPKSFAANGGSSVKPRDSADVGKTFATVTGTNPTYKLTGEEMYVRAIVTSNKPPAVPSYENQKAQAWTQPVGWEK